jgi:hypothetical protein
MNQTLRLSSLAIVVGAVLAFTPASATANAVASPSSLAFGSTNIGATSAAKTTTVNVTCSFQVGIFCFTPGHFLPSPGFGGANLADFHSTNDCGAGVTSPGSCTFTVSFTPTGAGSRTATMSLGAEDSGLISVPITTISLSGTGIGSPPAALPPATLSPPATGTRKKCKKHKKRSAAAAKKCKKKRAR